ncbi:copper amine oxidase [Actinacidiphila glaucinigra]
MIGITLPRDASGDDHSTTGGPAAAPGAPGRQDAGSGDATENEAPEGVHQSGLGPLTKAEVDRAKSIALHHRDAVRSARDVDGGRGPEYLDTDLAEPADATGANRPTGPDGSRCSSTTTGTTGDYSGEGTGWPIGKGRHDHSTSHYHSVFWRLDFGLDGADRAGVEQHDTKKAGRGAGSAVLKTTRTPVTKELAADSALRRWWRVVSTARKNADRHPRSWELVQQHSDRYDAHAYTSKDLYVTQYRACERLASGNSDPACRGRGTSVDKWANGEALTHPVMWVNVGFHRIPRDEDQTPMPIHWQGFRLAPRDVTAMSPLTPDELSGRNGRGQ